MAKGRKVCVGRGVGGGVCVCVCAWVCVCGGGAFSFIKSMDPLEKSYDDCYLDGQNHISIPFPFLASN